MFHVERYNTTFNYYFPRCCSFSQINWYYVLYVFTSLLHFLTEKITAYEVESIGFVMIEKGTLTLAVATRA